MAEKEKKSTNKKKTVSKKNISAKKKPTKKKEEDSLNLEQYREEVNRLFDEGIALDFVEDYLSSYIVGEESNRLLAYLTLLVRPSQLFLFGVSSTGKTHILDNVLRVIPKNRWRRFGGHTEASLKYLLEELGEEIDIFYLQEYSGSNESTRQQFRLLSRDDGGYTWTISLQDKESKKWHSEELDIKPISFMTTTTKPLDDQEITRGLILYPDDSREQNKGVAKFVLVGKATKHLQKDDWYDQEVCWAIYEYLRSLDLEVIFPYGSSKKDVLTDKTKILDIPYSSVKIRRDIHKVFFIAETISIFNSASRVIFAKDKVIRTGGLKKKYYLLMHLKDLEKTINLLMRQDKTSLSDLTPKEIVYIDIMKGMMKKPEEETTPTKKKENETILKHVEKKEDERVLGSPYTVRTIYNESKKHGRGESEDVIRRILNKLADKDYLVKDENPDCKRENIYSYTYKKIEGMSINYQKAGEAFRVWLEEQEEEDQELITTHDNFSNYQNYEEEEEEK